MYKQMLAAAAIAICAFLAPAQRYTGQGNIERVNPVPTGRGPAKVRSVARGVFRATLTIRAVQPDAAEYTSPPWGGSKQGPWLMVASLRIWKQKHEIEVPRSVFADLAGVNELSLRPVGPGCTLTLVGGDASTSWKADIATNEQRVVRRTVWEAGFPDEDFETTRYVRRYRPDM